MLPTKGRRDYNRVLMERLIWAEPNRWCAVSAMKWGEISAEVVKKNHWFPVVLPPSHGAQ